MLAPVVMSVVIAVAAALAWYYALVRYNRKRSREILRWIDVAFAGHGRVAAVRWTTPSRFRAHVALAPNIFRHASVVVQMIPREFPAAWLWSHLRKRTELLTFEADLDCAPGFSLQVHNYRWCGRTRRNAPCDPEQWTMQRCTPFVITTRSDWQREVTTMVNSLLTSRDREFVDVSFQRSSPHFAASIPLQSITPGTSASAEFFDVLRELAGGASASIG
jgi:hypothetical protein